MKAVVCPICNGSGKISVEEPTTAGGMKTCHGCGGKGWVEIHNDFYLCPKPYRLGDYEPTRWTTTTTNGRHSVSY